MAGNRARLSFVQRSDNVSRLRFGLKLAGPLDNFENFASVGLP